MYILVQWKEQVNAGNWRKIFIVKWTTAMRVFALVVVHKSRDATLWKSKICRFSFFCITPPPPTPAEYQWSTPHKHNTIQSLLGLGHYMKSYMRYRTITISFYDCNGEIIFVTDGLRAKMPQKLNFDWKKIRILGENGMNFKLKHRKAHNSILSRRFADPYRRRLLLYPGELACMIITLEN